MIHISTIIQTHWTVKAAVVIMSTVFVMVGDGMIDFVSPITTYEVKSVGLKWMHIKYFVARLIIDSLKYVHLAVTK